MSVRIEELVVVVAAGFWAKALRLDALIAQAQMLLGPVRFAVAMGG